MYLFVCDFIRHTFVQLTDRDDVMLLKDCRPVNKPPTKWGDGHD